MIWIEDVRDATPEEIKENAPQERQLQRGQQQKFHAFIIKADREEVKMNEKLYEAAENLEIKSKRLRDVIRSCEDEIIFVENGADIALYAPGRNVMYLSECHLSQEDDAVLRNVIKMMLKSHMEIAEKALKEIFSVKELAGRA